MLVAVSSWGVVVIKGEETYTSWCKWAACRCWEHSCPIVAESESVFSHLNCFQKTRDTYNHLIRLATRNPDALALDHLDVVQAAQDLVLDLELGAHGEGGALLDLEGVLLEVLGAAGGRQVDHDGRAARRVHGEGLDDADARVIGIRQVLAAAQAERLLIALQRLVALVWRVIAVSTGAVAGEFLDRRDRVLELEQDSGRVLPLALGGNTVGVGGTGAARTARGSAIGGMASLGGLLESDLLVGRHFWLAAGLGYIVECVIGGWEEQPKVGCDDAVGRVELGDQMSVVALLSSRRREQRGQCGGQCGEGEAENHKSRSVGAGVVVCSGGWWRAGESLRQNRATQRLLQGDLDPE